jgi:hypothetical protein
VNKPVGDIDAEFTETTPLKLDAVAQLLIPAELPVNHIYSARQRALNDPAETPPLCMAETMERIIENNYYQLGRGLLD